MLYGLRISPKVDPDFARSAAELMQSTSRNLIAAIGVLYLAWHMISTLAWPDRIGRGVWLITPVVALTFITAYWLLPRRPLASQAAWQVGLAAAITLAVYVFQQPEIAFLYALLPLMAVVTIGWPAGLAVEGLVSALALWLAGGSLVQPFPGGYSLGIVAGGALTGLLGWASERTLLTVTQWSLYSFAEAQKNLEEARQQRAQLARVLKDLDQAYYRLQRANTALVAARKAAEEAERFKTEFVVITHM